MTPPDPTRQRARRPWPWRLALALLPLLLLLSGSEVLLRVLDLAPLAEFGALSRGFDPLARYLIPDRTVPGGWVTCIYDGHVPEVLVPPKGTRRRVLFVGGSNVRALSASYLEQRLSELSPPGDRGWEVVNLGRDGYGSERVAILLEQALVLQPDVVLIYSGHNEFRERGFADELDEALSPWERQATEGLSRLATFRLLANLWADEPSSPETAQGAVRTPEAFEPAVGSLRDMTPDGTRRYLQAYRANLTRMVELPQQSGAVVVIATLVSNDFAPPVLSTPRPGLTAEQVTKLTSLRDLSIEAEPQSPVAGLALARRIRGTEWTHHRGLPPGRRPPELRPLAGRLADTPETRGPRNSIRGAHWPNPNGWSLKVIRCLEAYERLLNRDVDRAWLAVASWHVLECERALKIAPDDPEALYDLGICLWLLGEDDQRAAEMLRAASSNDRLPLAANAPINDIVREVAAAGGAVLVDADRLFRARCPDGLIGFEVMLDNCHLQPGAGQVLLQDLADKILEVAGD